MDDQKLEWLKNDIEELKHDVKELLADKNKRSGMIIVISALVSLAVAIISSWVNK